MWNVAFPIAEKAFANLLRGFLGTSFIIIKNIKAEYKNVR